VYLLLLLSHKTAHNIPQNILWTILHLSQLSSCILVEQINTNMHQTEQQTISFDSVGLHAAFEPAGVSRKLFSLNINGNSSLYQMTGSAKPTFSVHQHDVYCTPTAGYGPNKSFSPAPRGLLDHWNTLLADR